MLWQKVNRSPATKFVMVGALNVAVGYGSFILLVLAGLQYILASVGSHLLGVTNSYLWNKYFTFQQRNGSRRQFFRFFSVYTVQYFIGLFGLILLVEAAGLDPIGAQTIVLVISVAFSFFAHKHWTFRPVATAPKAAEKEPQRPS